MADCRFAPNPPYVLAPAHQPTANTDHTSACAPFGLLSLFYFLRRRGKQVVQALSILLLTAFSSLATAAITEEITYLHTDLSGSVKAASNSAGELLWSQTYQPYGATTVQTGQRIGFNQFEEEDSGLIYMGARYYDPQVGRFLTPDPVSQLTSIETHPMMVNRYAYANNNPISYTDPDGNNPKLILDFALNVGINMLLTGEPRFADAAIDTAKNAFNPLASVSKIKKIAVAIQAANRQMAKIGKGIEASGDVAKTAEARAKELHSVLDARAQRARTTAVTETKEGIRVVSSSERRLTPAQRAELKVNEEEGIGVGHAEVTGIEAAKKMGLTPSGTAASRPICPSCANALSESGIDKLSPLK